MINLFFLVIVGLAALSSADERFGEMKVKEMECFEYKEVPEAELEFIKKHGNGWWHYVLGNTAHARINSLTLTGKAPTPEALKTACSRISRRSDGFTLTGYGAHADYKCEDMAGKRTCLPDPESKRTNPEWAAERGTTEATIVWTHAEKYALGFRCSKSGSGMTTVWSLRSIDDKDVDDSVKAMVIAFVKEKGFNPDCQVKYERSGCPPAEPPMMGRSIKAPEPQGAGYAGGEATQAGRSLSAPAQGAGYGEGESAPAGRSISAREASTAAPEGRSISAREASTAAPEGRSISAHEANTAAPEGRSISAHEASTAAPGGRSISAPASEQGAGYGGEGSAAQAGRSLSAPAQGAGYAGSEAQAGRSISAMVSTAAPGGRSISAMDSTAAPGGRSIDGGEGRSIGGLDGRSMAATAQGAGYAGDASASQAGRSLSAPAQAGGYAGGDGPAPAQGGRSLSGALMAETYDEASVKEVECHDYPEVPESEMAFIKKHGNGWWNYVMGNKAHARISSLVLTGKQPTPEGIKTSCTRISIHSNGFSLTGFNARADFKCEDMGGKRSCLPDADSKVTNVEWAAERGTTEATIVWTHAEKYALGFRCSKSGHGLTTVWSLRSIEDKDPDEAVKTQVLAFIKEKGFKPENHILYERTGCPPAVDPPLGRSLSAMIPPDMMTQGAGYAEKAAQAGRSLSAPAQGAGYAGDAAQAGRSLSAPAPAQGAGYAGEEAAQAGRSAGGKPAPKAGEESSKEQGQGYAGRFGSQAGRSIFKIATAEPDPKQGAGYAGIESD